METKKFLQKLASVVSSAIVLLGLVTTVGCMNLAQEQKLEGGQLVVTGGIDAFALVGIAWLMFRSDQKEIEEASHE